MYDIAVVIGRFQPLHLAHEDLLKFAQKQATKVVVLVGSAHIARDIRNPFTYDERRTMIKASCPNVEVQDVVDQLYNDQLWVAQVQEAVERVSKPGDKIALVGFEKDHTSFYLDMFPSWDIVKLKDRIPGDDATAIRQKYFNGTVSELEVSADVKTFLFNFAKTKVFVNLCEEYKFITKYRQQFEGLKYPPFFNTADAVVICNGHILLVRRRSHPGKGLWAIPGGFVNVHEYVKDAIIRELYEETKLDVSRQLLTACLRSTHVFDAPGRSLRGRVVTHAGLFLLPHRELPKVKGSDDAVKAKWVPLANFYSMPDKLFEDHHSIGQYMINRAG